MIKCLLLCAALLGLNSCNTLIGVGRDTKQAFLWTKAKVQGNGSQGSQYESGAPVY